MTIINYNTVLWHYISIRCLGRQLSPINGHRGRWQGFRTTGQKKLLN